MKEEDDDDGRLMHNDLFSNSDNFPPAEVCRLDCDPAAFLFMFSFLIFFSKGLQIQLNSRKRTRILTRCLYRKVKYSFSF